MRIRTQVRAPLAMLAAWSILAAYCWYEVLVNDQTEFVYMLATTLCTSLIVVYAYRTMKELTR